MRQKYLWIEVDLAHNELPTGRMGNSARELAQLCGIREHGVTEAVSKAIQKGYRCRYVRIPLDENYYREE